jgi:hypothetical protein
MKNPRDATERNVKAANKKFARLREDIKEIRARLKALEKALKK